MKKLITVFYALLINFNAFCFADEWCGTEYVHNSSVQQSHALRLLNGLHFKGDEVILDVGCGDGKFSAMLAKQLPQATLIGIDPSDSMLLSAEEFTRCFSNLTFFKGWAETFSIDSFTFSTKKELSYH